MGFHAGPLWVAVAGNPNAGKSALFNAITGSRQRVGNYPGITVERKTGTAQVGGGSATFVDIPGAYSLAASSRDEQIVLDVLAGRVRDMPVPGVVVCVVDACNLRRNLFLTSQIGELGIPVVIALNMIDLAEKTGMTIDASRLAERLGVPVIPTVAVSGRGIPELLQAVARAAEEKPHITRVPWPAAVEDAVRAISREEKLAEWKCRRLLFDADVSPGENGVLSLAHESLRRSGLDPVSVEAVLRYKHVESLLVGIVTKPDRAKVERRYAVDRILTHRFWGMLVFFALMFGVFASIYWLAQPLMEIIGAGFGSLGANAARTLESAPLLRSFIADGVIAGVGGLVVFLPQILILFFFVALLEDTGYMARAAFLMDKVFSWTGLNGKSFVPMLSSFACAVPAILGARTIEDPKARLTTILVSPLMSCSARLPIYVLLIGAFIQPHTGPFWAGVALFGMHLVGLVVAIPIAFVINRFLLKMKGLPFLMELPPYRMPRLRDVAWRMFSNGREFIVRAGTVILLFAIVIWALTYFPAGRLETSYLASFGKTVQPVFAPAGFDWKTTVGVLASFPARENIIATLQIIYAVGEGDTELAAAMATDRRSDGSPVFTPLVAVAVMVFFALCLQCGSTVAVIGREAGWGWASFAFFAMTALAWLGAVATYQLGGLIPI